jgi:hypothetical protein
VRMSMRAARDLILVICAVISTACLVWLAEECPETPITEPLQFIGERPVLLIDWMHEVLVGVLTSSDIL